MYWCTIQTAMNIHLHSNIHCWEPLGSSSKLLIPERFWIEAILFCTRHLSMKILVLKGQVKSFNLSFSVFGISINLNTVQLCSTIQLIDSLGVLFNQLVQCTISLLSTRTQLHQLDAIVSQCGLQNHSRWIPGIWDTWRNWHGKPWSYIVILWVSMKLEGCS